MTHRILLSVLCLMLLTSCARSEDPITLSQTAAWQEGNASIVLSLPENWAWGPIEENADELPDGGIRFYPEDDPTADTVVRFTNGFGVCGTNLSTEEITLPGGTVIRSYNWGGGEPSLYRYLGTPGDYLAELSLDAEQRSAYFDTVMAILDAAQLGGDTIHEATAVVLTGVKEDEHTDLVSKFDAERGVWTIEVYSLDTKPRTHRSTYEVSGDGQTVIKTFDRENGQ